jgi:hypothetical protein
MILIALIIQSIMYLTITKHKALYIIGTGIVFGVINFLDLFSDIHYLKLSVQATVIYLIIVLTYLAQQLKFKNTKYREVLCFSFIFATMNIYIISLSLITTFIINNKTGINEKSKGIMLALSLAGLANIMFFSTYLEPLVVLVVLGILGITLIRFFTPTIFSYFILTSFVVLNPYVETYLYIFVLLFWSLFITREILLINKHKVIKNNFIDKMSFALLINGKTTNKKNIQNMDIIKNKIKSHNLFGLNIVSDENQLDAFLIFLIIGTITYLGVQFGSL